MLNIKKIGVLVTLAALSFCPARADGQKGKYVFSGSVIFGVHYGQGEEILYKYQESDQMVSQLLWDLKPLWYTGLALDYGPGEPFVNNGFTLSAGFKIGFPQKTGIMEDRDWDNKEADYLTHYSRHDAYSENAVFADISAGYSWRLADFLAIGIYGGFSFLRITWAAKDGYVQYPFPSSDQQRNYPAWDENYPKTSVNGTGILYTQNWFIMSPGISGKLRLNRFFFIEEKLNYSSLPLLCLYARDDHLLRDPEMVSLDFLFSGSFIENHSRFVFTPNKTLEFSFCLSFRTIKGSRGDSWVTFSDPDEEGIFYQNSYDGGASYSGIEYSFGVKINF